MKDNPNPPRAVLGLILAFVPLEERIHVRQAVHEVYCDLSASRGRGVAWLWCLGQLFRSLPDLISNSVYWSVEMFKNYMKITLRNLKKYKFYSVINISGLAIGIACCLVILLWMQGELSYDKFHENGKELYRIFRESPQGARVFHLTTTPSGLGPLLKERYPDIVDSARHTPTRWDIGRGEIHFRESVALVDESFLKMFSFPLLEGTLQAALKDPYSIVISNEMREKYFAGEDPLGKTLRVAESIDLNVTGVIENVPENSHVQFDCLVPFQLLGEFNYDMNEWGNNNYSTYIQLTEKASSLDVEEKISAVIQEHVPESSALLRLQPIGRIHLYTPGGGGLISYLYIFAGMAVFILLIACINYMNLSTARSANRAKEVGIRQVVGANRAQLIKQFMGESILFSFIALIIGLLLVQLFLPVSSRLAGKPITVDYSTGLILTLLGLTLFTGTLSGVYPALILSSLKSIQVLKSAIRFRGGRSLFRKILVVTQFSLSIFLVIGTLFVFRQMDFMMNKDLGYDKDNVVILPMRGQLFQNYAPFKTELLKNTSIISVARANTPPDIKQSSVAGYDFSWDGRQEGDSFAGINVMGVDADYLKTFNMEMAEGRFFSEEFPSDVPDSCVINEAAVAAMGLESPLGKRVYWDDFKGTIIGVIRDFHFSSLHDEIEPLMMRMGWGLDNICIRIRSDNIQGAIGSISTTLKDLLPNYTFEYAFLDTRIANRYLAEQRMERILMFSTIIAIFISCLGLLGLASFTAEQRTKEIGIRKVLGSSVAGIAALLNKEFMKWILIANLIAWPLAYFSVLNWMKNFAFRTKIGLDVFFLSGGMALTISLITVCYQSIKAARSDPVKSLRYE